MFSMKLVASLWPRGTTVTRNFMLLKKEPQTIFETHPLSNIGTRFLALYLVFFPHHTFTCQPIFPISKKKTLQSRSPENLPPVFSGPCYMVLDKLELFFQCKSFQKGFSTENQLLKPRSLARKWAVQVEMVMGS